MNTLKFNNGVFKIMQIADTQESANVNPDTVKLLTLALEREKPDLVVFTGDQLKGYSTTFRKNAFEKVIKTIAALLEPIEKLNIPFCMTFGNHDTDCGISKESQINIYKAHSGFISGKPRSSDDPATHTLQIKNSAGDKNIFNLYIIDSNRKIPGGSYAPVSKEQIEWYIAQREKIKEENGEYLPSLVFQHIPLPEYYNIIEKANRFSRGKVEAFGSHKNEYYKLDDETIANGGFMGESPAAPDINNGEFDAFKEKGEVLGVFVGHDHKNSFVKKLDGIDLGYTQCCGFNTYGPGAKRGVRIFELDENDIKNYKTYTVTMDELCDYKPSRPALECFASHAPSSPNVVFSAMKDAAKVLAAVGAVAFAAVKITKK